MITGLKGSERKYTFNNKNCSSCDLEFTPYHPRQKYCCEECQRIAARSKTRAWSKNNYNKERDYQLKYNYGISLDEYRDMYNSRNGKCDLCGSAKNVLDVDHCHDSGEVRGLLCGPCNRALGTLGDTKESIQKVLRYLNGS